MVASFDTTVSGLAAAAIALKCLFQVWLERLNARHVLAHAQAVPAASKGFIDEATYAKSAQYALARGGLRQVQLVWDSAVLIAVLFSGLLPWVYQWFAHVLGT